jgi:hypothetical protein
MGWPPGERTAEDYHKRFRSLISLTALVSRINHDDGQSAIFKGLQQNTSFDERKLPTRNLVLNAIATILVRNVEIVATACYDSELDTVSKTNGPPTYEVFVMQNAPSLAEDDSYFPPLPFDGTDFMAGITAVTNPRDKDKYFHDVKDCSRYLVVPQGKSHLGDINGNTLFKCLEIP